MAVFFITACGDDFLDLTPPDAISDVEAFETLDDFYAGLNGVYATIRQGSYWGKNMMMNFDVAVSDVYALEGFTNQWGTQYGWQISSTTGEGSNLWLVAYRVATRSSNLINNFPSLDEGTERERNQILGEAKALRAMAHFDLVRVFANPYRLSNPTNDLGVVIVTREDLEEKPRNTIEEVYTFVLEQLHEARDLITENRHRRFMGIDAVNALLARVYHEMGDWQNAITYATEVIDEVPLSSGQEYANIWQQDGDGAGNDEIIMIMAVHPTEFGNDLNLGSNFVGGNPPLPPNYQWRIDYVPADDLIAMYDKDNDIRYSSFFMEDIPVAAVPGGVTAFRKYPHDNPNFTQRGMNQMKVFRASEMYLIRAEAYAESGQEGPANDDLGALRAARIDGYSHTNLSGNDLLNAIYNERRKEMVLEGNRWFDLRRRGVGFQRTPQNGTGPFDNLVIEADNHRWVWPIPQGEMDANQLMRQNAGY